MPEGFDFCKVTKCILLFQRPLESILTLNKKRSIERLY